MQFTLKQPPIIMKKIILLALLTIALFACKQNNNPFLNGDVSSTKESNYEVSEKFGEIIKGDLMNIHAVETSEYDENGNQIKFVIYNGDGEEDYKSITTYENNEPTEIHTKRNDYMAAFTEKRTIISKDRFKTIWLVAKKEDNSLLNDTIIDVQSEDKRKETYTVKRADGTQSISYYTYDDRERIIELKWLMNGKDLHQWDVNTYDDNLLTQKNQMNPNTGEVRTTLTYKYKLDDQQNWIERITFEDGEATQLTERIINYR